MQMPAGTKVPDKKAQRQKLLSSKALQDEGARLLRRLIE